MRMFHILKILRIESEFWIAYLHGQKLNQLNHLYPSKLRFKGVFWRSIAYFKFVILNFKFKTTNLDLLKEDKDLLFYAGTNNQAKSLESTISASKKYNVSFNAITKLNSECDDKVSVFTPIGLGFYDSFLCFILYLIRFISIVNTRNKGKTSVFLHKYLYSHYYLLLFYRIIKKTNPKFVIVANDHNVCNRSLIAVCHYLKIKTVYMQHASVSDLFPALRYNYAFLDGKNAQKIYEKCSNNISKSADLVYPYPEIVLSGQKKILKLRNLSNNDFNIGVAVNILDPYESVFEVIDFLCENNYLIFLRWHPSQKKDYIDKIYNKYINNKNVILSDPHNESLSRYFSNIKYLVSGNSSILLEAALSRRMPIYYQFDVNGIYDYYGYVKNGLSSHAESLNKLLQIIDKFKVFSTEQIKIIQKYSSTFETQYEGKEGELVIKKLININKC